MNPRLTDTRKYTQRKSNKVSFKKMTVKVKNYQMCFAKTMPRANYDL